jgi:hypothetical protein
VGADEGRERRSGVFVVFDPRTPGVVVPKDSQAPPVFELLLDILRRRFGLKSQRMTAEIHQAAPRVIVGMVKFLREAGQRIMPVSRDSAPAASSVAPCVAVHRAVGHLPGACMTVPQWVQVRCARLE